MGYVRVPLNMRAGLQALATCLHSFVWRIQCMSVKRSLGDNIAYSYASLVCAGASGVCVSVSVSVPSNMRIVQPLSAHVTHRESAERDGARMKGCKEEAL